MHYTSFRKIYFVLVLLHLATLYVNDNSSIIGISKLLIVGSLIAWWMHKKGFTISLSRIYGFGLVFCFIGDLLLLQSDFFLFGLFSFLVAQLLYSYVFLKKLYELESKKLGLIVGISTSILLLVLLLLPRIDLVDPLLSIPIFFYSICILFMFALAISLTIANWSNWKWLALSALLFVFSDVLLAWSMFIHEFNYQSIYIMGTYGLAQFGIMRSLNLTLLPD